MFSVSATALQEHVDTLRNNYHSLWTEISENDRISSLKLNEKLTRLSKLSKYSDLAATLRDKPMNGVQALEYIFSIKDDLANVDTRQDEVSLPKFTFTAPAADPDQCDLSIKTEAQERLRNIVEINFATDRGLIMLENDLLLYSDGSMDMNTFLEIMQSSWADRLHSGWLAEFMEALHLWVLAEVV